MKINLSDYKKAQAANYVKLMKLMPGRAEPVQGLLQIYRELKQPDKVAEYESKLEELKIKYRKRMELSPSGREHLQMLDRHSTMPAEELEGRYKSFDDWFDESTELDIDDAQAHCMLAGEFEASGKTEIADELCAALESAGFERHRILAWRADSLAENGQVEMAVPYWQEALGLSADNLDALMGLAIYYILIGNLEDAILYLEPAYRLDKKNEEIQSYLIRAYASVDRFDDAEQLLATFRPKNQALADQIAAEINIGRTYAEGDGEIPIERA